MTVGNLALAAAVASPFFAAIVFAMRPGRRLWFLAPVAGLPALGVALLGRSGANLELPGVLQHALLVMDPTARVFLGFTSALYIASAWYAVGFLKNDHHPRRFFVLFFLAMAGNIGLILAGDVPTFFAAFALMGLSSAGLVLHHGDAAARRAGRIYLSLTMIGEVVILTGLAQLAVVAGTTEIAALQSGEPSTLAMVLLLVGFGVKAGALTLHFWLPLAHPAAPVPASAVLSGTMIKAGLLGWIRFLPFGEIEAPGLGFTFITAGLAAALLGAAVGAVQTNPKTVLAYSSVCQMGILMTGLGIGALRPQEWPTILTAVLIYTAHHALAKGALFLGLGPVYSAGSRLEVVAARVGIVVPALALAGAPLTSGALAKVALKSNLEFLPYGLAGVMNLLLPLAAVGTTVMMVRFGVLAWRSTGASADQAGRGIWMPWALLVAAVFAGVWLLPGASGWLPAKLTAAKLWLATWPLLVGGALAALGAWIRKTWGGDPSRWLPPGDVGVLVGGFVSRLSVNPRASRERQTDSQLDHSQTLVRDRIRRQLVAAEKLLAEWPMAGFLLMLLLSALLVLLAGSPSAGA